MKLDALLEAVLAAPDDDEPRLVFADYLLEHGDARGELIVVQCERERLEREGQTTTPAYRTACWREHELLERFGVGSYRRGFVSRVTLADPTTAALGGLTDELVETIAIRTANGVLDLDARLVREALPRLPARESLWPTERGLPHPLLVPAVRAARYRLPTERTIRDLIETEAPNLRHVECAGRLQFTADALQRYAETPSYARLERFALWRLDASEAAFFLEHAPPLVSALTVVVDHEERAEREMASRLRACPALPGVRELHVGVAPFERAEVELLHERAPRLERWTVSSGISEDAREAVARGPLTKRLRHLEMSFAGLPDVSNLVTAPWERLTSLALGNARLGWEIVEAPALETLVSLRLFGCECDPRVEFHVKRRWPAARIE